jgi:para-nitrobenzyl esterase
VGQEHNSVISYKGIPYAQPPVGKLRWKEPVSAADDDGVYEAYYYGNSPIQSKWPSEVASYYHQGEDCLTLNVWSNETGPSEGKTVMVFFHGGSFGWGGTCDPMYDGENLVQKYPDVVLVTVESRLGLLGYVDFTEVPGGEDYPTSGNLGLLDQVCALQWVQKNISAFGGDPDNVTIFGESAGGGSVSLLPLVEGTEGLFRRVIAQSGSVSLTFSREESKKQTQVLLEESGCTNMAELQMLSEEEIHRIIEEVSDFNDFPERDGVVLSEDLYRAWEQERLADIDLLIGTNADEVRYWVNEMGYYSPMVPGLFVYTHASVIDGTALALWNTILSTKYRTNRAGLKCAI